MKRPYRKRKDDLLIAPGSTREQIECDFVCGPLDDKARAMELKWGVNRLPDLVSVETARKYGAAMAHLNECLEAVDRDKTAAAAMNCIKGLEAMDREAEVAGKPQAWPDVLEYELDGFRFGILPDAAYWPAVAAERPDLRLFTMREIAIALKAMKTDFHLVDAAKHAFGPAEITAIRDKTKPQRSLEDEIPW